MARETDGYYPLENRAMQQQYDNKPNLPGNDFIGKQAEAAREMTLIERLSSLNTRLENLIKQVYEIELNAGRRLERIERTVGIGPKD